MAMIGGAHMIKGIPVSSGIGMAKALLLAAEPEQTAIRQIQPEQVAAETARLDRSVEQAAAQLQELAEKARVAAGEEQAAILEAHQAFLADPSFVGEMKNRIEAQQIDAESAVRQVAEEFVQIFESMEDAYMRERAADIRDVGKRLLQNLRGGGSNTLASISEPVILVADDLTPSDTIQMPREYVMGIVTVTGGATSHAAILARSLGVPAVMGVGEALFAQVKQGDHLIIDGSTGEILINPDQETEARYTALLEKEWERKQALNQIRDLKAQTTDGHEVSLMANIGGSEDVASLLEKGAEGIGLFRSEFLFMDREELPSEEEQFQAYVRVVQGMRGKPVIIRTLDVGGDKQLPYLDLPKEMNPFLGWRAIRISLDRHDLFKDQLRAILRASAFGKALIMFPMISHLEQLHQAKAVLEEAKQELRAAGVAFDEAIEVGVMIEVPAACLIADELAREVQFFSIGTNDLVQYTVAVDRMNEKISGLYDYFHPAVLRLMKLVIDASHRHGIWTGLCGEMAADPLATELLLGLGLDEYSTNENSLLEIKQRIRESSFAEAQQVAAEALAMATPADVRAYLASRLKR